MNVARVIQPVLAALVLAAALAGCASNDPQRQWDSGIARGLFDQAVARLSGEAGELPQAAAEPGEVARLLALLPPVPVLRLDLPNGGQSSFVLLSTTNAGTVTFSTFSGQTLTFRGAVVTATRGFGADLMGADIADAEARIAARARASYVRRHRFLDGEDDEIVLAFDCVLEPVGAATVTLVSGARFATTRMRETCERGALAFNNFYWVTAGGVVVRTRQWISPRIGPMDLEILRR